MQEAGMPIFLVFAPVIIC